MKYLVRKSVVAVVGGIWMPPGAICAYDYTLTDHDVANIKDRGDGAITRDALDEWLGCHAGDFSSIKDFSASIEDGDESIEIPWATEDGECAYLDCFADPA